jgi:cyclophilin family peptidyl-prolyl cis-trans isomerase
VLGLGAIATKVRAMNVLVETNLGSISIALDAARAPKTVDNFLAYVDAGHYDGTVFHRVIPGFMAQGGGFDGSFAKRPTRAPVANEADNGLKNVRGSVAMARTSDPHSATAQFFINLSDNAFLDHKGKSDRDWGYTVFGTVTAGMDVVDAMAARPTGSKGSFSKDAPLEDIVIHSVRRA